MNNSRFISSLSSTFLDQVRSKTNWGKVQANQLLQDSMPASTPEYLDLIAHVQYQFAKKVGIKSSWGKNQIELMFIASVANAALLMLDGQAV